MVKKNKSRSKKDKFLNVLSIIMILTAVFSLGFLVADKVLSKQYDKSILDMENQYNENLGILTQNSLNTNVSFKPETMPKTEEEIVNNCKLLNLRETAQCLAENVGTFYKYTITDDRLNLTLQDIQSLGGDCRDYALLYERLAVKLNVKSTTRTYQGIKDIMGSHRWAIIWDDYEYCKLDQMRVSCYKSKKAINNDEIK